MPAQTESEFFEIALQHHQAGRLQQAENIYRRILRDNPGHDGALYLLGTLCHQTGNNEMAVDFISRAISIDPSNPFFHDNLGTVFQALGRLDEAISCYRQALFLDPDFGGAHFNLGNALNRQGQPDKAADCYRKALALDPGFADAYISLGNTLKNLGRPDEAMACYQKSLALDPNYAEAHFNLGILLQEQGKLDEAIARYQKTLALKQDYAEAHRNLAGVLRIQGKLEEAAESCQKALIAAPDQAEFHAALGDVLFEQGRFGPAIGSYRRAKELKPDFAVAHFNLGNALTELGQPDEAVSSYRRALELQPGFAAAHNNLGNALKELGQLADAVSSYRRVLELQPDFAEAHNNLGLALAGLGQQDEAMASFRRAGELKPDFVEAHYNLGNALRELGQLDEAVSSYRRALALKPDYSEAYSNLLFSLNYHPDLDAEDIYLAYREYDAAKGIPLRSSWRAHNNDRNPMRRLRVGYVSPDFYNHACATFLEPLLAHHDKTQVEVYAYAELAREDDVTDRYKRHVDRWIPTRGMSDEALAERIRSDGIDILVDLAGHTTGNRLLAFARKPAPVSVSWLGYGYTTGLSAIDYYLTDAASAPMGSEALFSEQPWRIAAPAFVFRPKPGMGEVGSLPALQRGHITFGTLTRSIRVNHRTIRAWSEILEAVPNSRLVMDSANFKDPAIQECTAARFAERGIARERLEMGFNSPPWDILRGMDIGLDCFPHNSGTTLCESLYMGLPYITLAGRPSVGRLGSSILQGAGHPEWIAASADEYVAKAVELARDMAGLAQIRAALRGEMEAGPLRDEAGFARKVEAAYRGMWQDWCGFRMIISGSRGGENRE